MRNKILALTLGIIFGVGQVLGSSAEPIKTDKGETSKEHTITSNLTEANIVFSIDEEMYIDDIPFETEEIVVAMGSSDVKMPLSYMAFSLDEEAYIDDIPFDTEEIASAALGTTLPLDFEMDEEAYIDDIPFDTNLVYQCYQKNCKKACELVKN